MRSFLSGLSLLGSIAIFSQVANASIILSITDDGTDLTIRATGLYDFSQANRFAYDTATLIPNAAVQPIFEIYGWQISSDATDSEWIRISAKNELTQADGIWPANTISTNTPFWFITGGMERLYIPKTAPNIGSVNETAIFQGVTLESCGIVPNETMTISWTGDSMTVTTSIPEPSTLVLIGSGSIAIVLCRSKKGVRKGIL
ncbi:PEP-CTERM sorting domain-containing protein [Pontiella sulfatireligans]|uniref:Ice-binding protein C-terminal domain-containing protein n=1 Tax=Pontiella sulfatireligans TaxID=2750658 RepID=A0A6C2UND4_9BACT|nr:PEP-CTERM sorting domain-containing protein [Pontiella sulfatireligans]VGO21790.1 hypothetical protein SCARR_03867 [Pontiella sulfatireligans]